MTTPRYRGDAMTPTDPEPEALGFAATLREVRKATGITLRALAPIVGADFTYLSKIEHGHDRPSRDLVERIDAALGADGTLCDAFDRLPCPACGRLPLDITPADAAPVERLRAALEVARPKHLVVDEDCWYSCPKAQGDWRDGSACCDEDALARGVCTCGADRMNAAIDAALAETHPSPTGGRP